MSTLPCEVAAYVAIHTFGIRMLYPGSLGILQSFLHTMLVQGRAKLIEHDRGIRYKLKTVDSNDIDTLFIDNRARTKDDQANGRTLVICSEGNAGFYEIGIMVTPIALKYSVLGWNHPGFAGSTVNITYFVVIRLRSELSMNLLKIKIKSFLIGNAISRTRSKCN